MPHWFAYGYGHSLKAGEIREEDVYIQADRLAWLMGLLSQPPTVFLDWQLAFARSGLPMPAPEKWLFAQYVELAAVPQEVKTHAEDIDKDSGLKVICRFGNRKAYSLETVLGYARREGFYFPYGWQDSGDGAKASTEASVEDQDETGKTGEIKGVAPAGVTPAATLEQTKAFSPNVEAVDLYFKKLLGEFVKHLNQKAEADKTDKTESLLLRGYAVQLNRFLGNPSAYLPGAHTRPGISAYVLFDAHIKSEAKKHGRERTNAEQITANIVLCEWEELIYQNNDAIYKAYQGQLNNTEAPQAEHKPISFYQAATLLADKLKTSKEVAEHELVGRMACDDLKAYTSASLNQESAFNNSVYHDKSKNSGYEYLPYYQGCYFRLSDILRLKPEQKYITGYSLIERWLGHCGSKQGVITKILACGAEKCKARGHGKRLFGFHPFWFSATAILGKNEPEQNYLHAPMEMHLFSLEEAKCIEREDFGVSDGLRLIVGPNFDSSADEQAMQAGEDNSGRAEENSGQASIIRKIGGRDVLPVWALPYVNLKGWSVLVGAEDILCSLAHQDRGRIVPDFLTGYKLNTFGAPVPIEPIVWEDCLDYVARITEGLKAA